MASIQTIGVVGAGTMGHGIAQVFAQAGFDVRLQDVAPAALERATAGVSRSLDKLVTKGTLTAEAASAARGRLSTSTDLDALAEADYVVEAIVEDADAKRRLFSTLDKMLGPEVILASNTSSISVTTLGAATARPDRVLGMHFMNPVPLMPLVELIRGHATSSDALATATALCERLGRHRSRPPTTPDSSPIEFSCR